jgi:hypothetical protein
MLRVWLLVLVITALVLAADGGKSVGRPMFCLNASELGLAGSAPDLAASVFERGRWRPAQIYIEPENITIAWVPLLTGNRTDDDIAKAFQHGRLPPPTLKNTTRICLETSRGAPSSPPPGYGRLVELEHRGARYHVFIARVSDVVDVTAFELATPGFERGERPEKVRWYERGNKPSPPPEVDAQRLPQIQTLSFLSSFDLYGVSTSLQPNSCTRTLVDLPPGTGTAALVLMAGTTPGSYSYTIYRYRGGNLITGSVTYSQGQRYVTAAWIDSGEGSYSVTICNTNNYVAQTKVALFILATNQQYFRRDTIKTPNLSIATYYLCDLGLCPRNTIYIHKNTYFAIPGFIIDSASSIQLYVYAKVDKYTAPSGTAHVYWGDYYVGTLQAKTSGNTMIFEGTFTLPYSLILNLVLTKGNGGVILIGPFTIYANSIYKVKVMASIVRPVELAPADVSLYANKYVRRLSDTFLFLDSRAFMVKLDYFQLDITERYLSISTMPLDIYPYSHYSTVKLYVKFYDSSLNPLPVTVATTSGVMTKGWWGDLFKYLSKIAAALGIYDLIKSTYDALKRAVQGLPVVGYVALALDAYASAAFGAYLDAYVTDNGYTLVLKLYTAGYNDPLTAYVTFALGGRPEYIAVTKVEYGSSATQYKEFTEYDGGPLQSFTSVAYMRGYPQPGGFSYRTLLCGAQEQIDAPSDRCDPAYYR